MLALDTYGFYMRRYHLCILAMIAATPAMADVEAAVPLGRFENQATFDWGVSLRIFAGKNDNVQYFNDFLSPPVPSESAFTGASVVGRASAPLGAGWSAGATLRLDRLRYREGESETFFDSADDYDLDVVDLTLQAGRSFTLGDLPATFSGSLNWRKETAPGVNGLGHSAWGYGASLALELPDHYDLTFDYQRSLQDWDTGFSDVDDPSVRDGGFSRVSATLGRPVALGPLARLSGTLARETYDGDGENWSYQGWRAGVNAEFYLAPDLSATAGYDRAFMEFDEDFTSLGYIPEPGRDWQQVDTLSLGVGYQVAPGHNIDLAWQRQWIDSNDDNFTADQSIFTVGYTWVIR